MGGLWCGGSLPLCCESQAGVESYLFACVLVGRHFVWETTAILDQYVRLMKDMGSGKMRKPGIA